MVIKDAQYCFERRCFPFPRTIFSYSKSLAYRGKYQPIIAEELLFSTFQIEPNEAARYRRQAPQMLVVECIDHSAETKGRP
jgi:hypothetical protein